MKQLFYFTLSASILTGLISACSEDDAIPLLQIESEQVLNLHAPQSTDYMTTPPTVTGEFVKFDFSSGKATTSEDDWDIAFRGTTILVNGGSASGISGEPQRTKDAAAYITDNIFANVDAVAEDLFLQDGPSTLAIPTGYGKGWYTYNPAINAITPIAGKVIVVRTADKRYAKMEILSYYKDAPASITPEIAIGQARYYTFNYVFQPNEGVTTFD